MFIYIVFKKHGNTWLCIFKYNHTKLDVWRKETNSYTKITPKGTFAPVDTAVCTTNPFQFAWVWVVYFTLNKSSTLQFIKANQTLSSSNAMGISPSRWLMLICWHILFTMSSTVIQIGLSRRLELIDEKDIFFFSAIAFQIFSNPSSRIYIWYGSCSNSFFFIFYVPSPCMNTCKDYSTKVLVPFYFFPS